MPFGQEAEARSTLDEFLVPRDTRPGFHDRARELLEISWSRASGETAANEPIAPLNDNINTAIQSLVNSNTLTYRYAILTQVLAKNVDSSLDCRSVQQSAARKGSFDARSLCHAVVVPFDRANHSVLGGSPEPYVNNPIRIPSITARYRKQQRDKAGYDLLAGVLDFLEETPDSRSAVLAEVLSAILVRLQSVAIAYPAPNRVSLEQTLAIVEKFLGTRSGGARLQVVAVSLFRAIGTNFNLFTEVRSANVNASDTSTGKVADLECMNASGHVVLAVEVKDRQLDLRQVGDKLTTVRERGIAELIFLVQGGTATGDIAELTSLKERQFSTGQNIYTCEFSQFIESVLVLFGERGRRTFLLNVGEELDARRIDLSHRRAWKTLLESI